MARKLIAATDDAEFQPTVSVSLGFRFVQGLVREHLGQDAADMLAEPQPIGTEGRRQWMIEAPIAAQAVPLGGANPDAAASAREVLVGMRDRAARLYAKLSVSADEKTRHKAVLLLRCFELPDDDRHAILVAGKLALVAWGHVYAGTIPVDPAVLAARFKRPVPPPALPPPTELPAAAPPRLAGPPPLPPERRSYGVLLGIAGGLVGLLCLMLLLVCEIRIPGTTIRLSFRSSCAPDIATVAEERGGERGKLQVTLAWTTPDDIDLDIECPGGMITRLQNRVGPGICGDGVHNLDANGDREHPVNDPVENVSWRRDIPNGEYRVRVRPYNMTGNDPVAYSVQVTYEDERRICTGTVKAGVRGENGWGEYPIKFRPGHPLAECQAERFPMYLCDPDCPK